MKSIPNIISIFRILLVPLFVVLYFTDASGTKAFAVLIYVVAALSDFLDGFLARKYKATSKLGKFLDPLGDKLMLISILICITVDGIIPVWAVLAAGVKELLMAIGGYIVYRRMGSELPPSNVLGKASTVVFFVISVALMLFRNIPGHWATALISVAIVLMFIALASYINTYVSIIKKKCRPPCDHNYVQDAK